MAEFPVKETLIRAIHNGHYKSWPGITADIISKHFPEAIETQKGHMKKQCQNICSTKQPQLVSKEEELEKALATHNIMAKVINANSTIYTDQNGHLPIQSSRGNKLLMILFDVNANYIDAEPLQASRDTSLIKA